MAGVKRLVVCADDFGQNPAIDAGIVGLARAGRVTAVSCLALGPAFARDAAALAASGVALGLHLDLTDGFGGEPPRSLASLLLRSHLRALDERAVARRIAAQLDAFEAAVGRAPAFVDGHRHVHQLPVVRRALVGLIGARYRARPPLVRCTVPRRWRGFKAWVIAALGGGGLRRLLEAHGIPFNLDFGGVYSLDPAAPYGELMRGWLASLEDGGLLMCHPGAAADAAADEAADPHPLARRRELAYLGSEEFEADCVTAGVRRVPVSALSAS
jgi:chitin disaccharide deacetylase